MDKQTTTTPQANERLMLVKLNICQWTPRKFDRKATQELADLHNVSAERAGRFNKILVNLESIKPLQQRMRELREAHYAMTAPWDDNGSRCLMSNLYFDYTEMARTADDEISRLADDYVLNDYRRERDKAERELNSLFNEDDYPQHGELREKFSVAYNFEPLPNANDVRVWGIGDEAIKQIEADVRQNLNSQVERAQADVINRVAERAQEFIDKVRKFDTQAAQKVKRNRLFDSAIENLRDVVDLVIRGLNVTGDQAVEKLARDLKKSLAGLNTEQLRNSGSEREKRTAQVDKILQKFQGVYGSSA